MTPHIPPALIKTSIEEVTKTSRAFLEKVAGPAAEELGLLLQDKVRLYRFKNQVKMLDKARAILKEAGISPSVVPLRSLLPILEGAALEDNEYLADKWAALLANAAADETGGNSHPSFPHILSELSPNDARFLDLLAKHTSKVPFEKFKVEAMQALGLSDIDFHRSFGNLFRLGLCWNTDGTPQVGLEVNRFGRFFVAACQPNVPLSREGT
jgi:Abortive infection alpha